MVQRARARGCGRPGRNRRSASRPPPAASCRRIPARCADRAAAGRRPGPISSVAKACRCASLPGETCRAAVSTSMKPCASNQAAQGRRDPAARQQERPAARRARRVNQKGGLIAHIYLSAAAWRETTGIPRQDQYGARPKPRPRCGPPTQSRIVIVKVIASSLRKGNVVENDGKLYVVLTAENFHPGKGTPTTQIDMRRISDGVKISQRYKTTEQVERAHRRGPRVQLPLPGRRRLPLHERARPTTRSRCRPTWSATMAPYLQEA